MLIVICAHPNPAVPLGLRALLTCGADWECRLCSRASPACRDAGVGIVVRCGHSTHWQPVRGTCPPLSDIPPAVLISDGWLETSEAVQKAGFAGYLGPGWSSGFLVEAARRVLAGGSLYHACNEGVRPPVPLLTECQVQVLRLVAEGLTDEEIAERLERSVHTVRRRLEAVQAKFGTLRRSELAAWAAVGGIWEPASAVERHTGG